MQQMIDPRWMTVPRPTDPLEAAIVYCGSRAALADALGYTASAISQWSARKRIPLRAAVAIEALTLGEVPRGWILEHYSGDTGSTEAAGAVEHEQ